MKKIIIILVCAGLSNTLSAQKISIDKVPVVVKQALVKAHPSAQAKWEWEDNVYEANFKEGGREISCTITKTGELKETETAINMDELPKAIKDYVAKNYAGKKISETSKIVSDSGGATYEVAVAGKELIFGDDGKLKSEKKEDND